MARLKALIKDPGRVVRQLAADGLAVIEERPAAPGEPSPAPAEEPFLELNAEQQAAYSTLQGALAGGGYKGFLLEGVTGSGKTEVYLHAVRETLALGRGALLLVPETGSGRGSATGWRCSTAPWRNASASKPGTGCAMAAPTS